jgi:AcrR family transcriptional regulator
MPSSRNIAHRRPTEASRRRPRRDVPRDSRARLLSSGLQLVQKGGGEIVDVESVCELAGSSRGSFDESFADRTDFLLAVFDEFAERARADVDAAARRHARWADRVRAAVHQLLARIERHPLQARFVIVEAAAGEPPLRARRARLLADLTQALEAGAPEPASESAPAPFDADALVATAVAILHGRLLEDPVPPLRDLAGPLMAAIVLPYMGAEAARAELSHPPPKEPRRRP